MCCPTPRAARAYFLSGLFVALVLVGASVWELIYSSGFVSSGGLCSFPLPASAILQAYINMSAGGALAVTSLFFGALAACGITCCTEVLATIVHVLAFGVVLTENAYMSFVVFTGGRWAASTAGTLVECSIPYYQGIAVYVMILWVSIVAVPLLCWLVVHCCCGCAVDEAKEEDAAKGRSCCAAAQRGGRADAEGAPLTGAEPSAGGVAPKRD